MLYLYVIFIAICVVLFFIHYVSVLCFIKLFFIYSYSLFNLLETGKKYNLLNVISVFIMVLGLFEKKKSFKLFCSFVYKTMVQMHIPFGFFDINKYWNMHKADFMIT